MDEKQSIGSRIGDFAYLAAVCFLAWIKILNNWQIFALMSGFAAARYAVKAIKENKSAAKEMIVTAISAASGISGQQAANPNSIRPYPPNEPPTGDISRNETRPIPRVDPPYEGRGRIKRIALELIPILVGILLFFIVSGCDKIGILP
jgi:hypothetical protein